MEGLADCDELGKPRASRVKGSELCEERLKDASCASVRLLPVPKAGGAASTAAMVLAGRSVLTVAISDCERGGRVRASQARWDDSS